MKKLLLSLALFALNAGLGFADPIQTLSLQDSVSGTNSGTYHSNDTFTIDAYLAVSGYNTGSVGQADGLSYWLQANSALAPYLKIVSNTYFTFTDPTDSTVSKTFTDSDGANSGFFSESGDLGATANPGEDQNDGTYLVTELTFSLTGAPIGTYTIATTTLDDKASEVNDSNFNTFDLPESDYTLMITGQNSVPDTGSTLALLGLSALGLVCISRRTGV